MLSGTGVIARWIICVGWFPALVVGLVFLVCYSPIYYLFSLFVPSKTKPKTVVTNKLGRPIQARLVIRHA
jgi:hypothetical protein